MDFLAALLIGLLAGAHAATWGMYKDAIHEGFSYRKYVRSIVLGGALGLALQGAVGFDLARAANMVLLFGVTYVAERAVVELWKTFIREEDQSKYFIPMQFAVFGRPVRSRAARWLVGAACATAIALGLWLLAGLERATAGAPRPLVAALLGALGGCFTAVGGAWKDAPKEGFEPLKFFRSPLLTLAFALLLAVFTDRYVLIVLAALGFERAAIETYKTFFFPSKPRGKFAGKPVLYPEMLTRRQRFVPLYVAIWLAVIAAAVAALAEPRRGLLGPA